MNQPLQFGFLLTAMLSASLGAGAARAQNADRPNPRQNPPQASRNFQPNDNRPPSATTNRNRPDHFPPGNGPGSSYDRPNNVYSDRPNSGARMSPRQQIGAGAERPFVDQ